MTARASFARLRRHVATPGRRADNPTPEFRAPRRRCEEAEARESIAMREPSRQTTARLIAGEDAPRQRPGPDRGGQDLRRHRRCRTEVAAGRVEPFGRRACRGVCRSLTAPPSRSGSGCGRGRFQLGQHGGVVFCRRAFRASNPGVKLDIAGLDQVLEVIEAPIIELFDMDIGKPADDQSISRTPRRQARTKACAGAHPVLARSFGHRGSFIALILSETRRPLSSS